MAKSEPNLRTSGLPLGVRIVGWFYITAAVSGLVSAPMEWISEFRAGTLIIPLGIGVPAFFVGRGLLRGNHRAWWIARAVAIVAILTTLVVVVVGLIRPDLGEVSGPFGFQRPARPWDPLLLAIGVGHLAFWGWQYYVLSRSNTKRLFGSP